MRLAILAASEEGGQPLRAGRLLAAARQRGVKATAIDLTKQKLSDAGVGVDIVLLVTNDYPALLLMNCKMAEIKQEFAGAKFFCTGPSSHFNRARIEEKFGVQVLSSLDDFTVIDGACGGIGLGLRGAGHVVPERGTFLPLKAYGMAEVPDPCANDPYDRPFQSRIQGNIQASIGCIHVCKYCGEPAEDDRRRRSNEPGVTKAKQSMLPREVILADVANQVKMGARHIAITDADAFSFPTPALGNIEEMHRVHPDLTFEAVTRVDHIIKCRNDLAALKRFGLVRVTSSFEFPSDKVLDAIDKGFKADRIPVAIDLCKKAGIQLKPTFIPFNPWLTADEILGLPAWLEKNELVSSTDPSQLCTRLLLYKGSLLLKEPSIQGLKLKEEEWHWEWEHPDPAVDQIYKYVVAAAGPGKR